MLDYEGSLDLLRSFSNGTLIELTKSVSSENIPQHALLRKVATAIYGPDNTYLLVHVAAIGVMLSVVLAERLQEAEVRIAAV